MGNWEKHFFLFKKKNSIIIITDYLLPLKNRKKSPVKEDELKMK